MAAAKRKISPAPAADDDSSSSSSDSEQQHVTQRNTPRPQTPKPTDRDDHESDSDSDSGSESDPEPPIKTLKTPPKPSESEDSSEEDEEEEEQEKLKSPAITLKVSQKPSESEDSSEEDEEEKVQEEVKKLKSPVKTLKTSQKPSESEDSSEEEEEEEQEQVEKPKSLAKEPESQPDKKKQKLPTPDQSPSKKSSMIHRIWSSEDEMSLLRALSEYQVRNGKLPPKKDYASFLSGISGSIGFPVTEKQLFNKIHHMRFSYSQKKKKGSNINFTQPHEKAVFDLCTKLFEDGNNASKDGTSQETNRDAETKRKRKKGITEAGSLIVANGGTTTIDNGGAANGGVVNGAVANGGDVARSHFFLEGLIKDMISTEKCPRWLSTVEDVVALIGESRAHDLEAKTKMLRIDAIKLRASEAKLMAEFFDILADEMVED